MTLFKKNSLTQMLGPESGMRETNSCPPPQPSGWGQGRGPSWGMPCARGHGVEPALGPGPPLAPVPSRPRRPCRPSRVSLSWPAHRPQRPRPGALRHSLQLLCAHIPRPGELQASSPAGLPACVHHGLQPDTTLSALQAHTSRKPLGRAQEGLFPVGNWQILSPTTRRLQQGPAHRPSGRG